MNTPSLSVNQIQRAALWLIAGNILIYLCSFVKSLILAKYYGTSAELDAYFLSLTPLFFITGILNGVIPSVLIPKYLELVEQRGNDYAFSFLGTFVCYILIGLIGFSFIFALGSPLFALYLGPGFDPILVTFLTSLLRVSMVLLILQVINDIGICLLHAHQRFLFSAFVPLINAGGSLWFMIQFHIYGVISLMYGLIFGMFLQNSVMVYVFFKMFPRRCQLFSPVHREIIHTFRLMKPLLFGSSFGHINVTVDQMMASTLPAGSISALNYATKLHKALTQMFIMGVSRVMFPFLARQAAEHNLNAIKMTFYQTLRRTLLIVLPISIGILFLGKQAIRILFERGAFTSSSTTATANAWIAYTLGLPIQTIKIFTARVYNALQKNTPLMYVSALNIGLNIGLNLIFMNIWGHVGIALSTSVTCVITTVILVFLLHQKYFRDTLH